MKILQIAALEEPVPPEKYGGVELVVYNQTEEFVKMGHEVYLIASGDSKTSANLIPLAEQSLRKLHPNDLDVGETTLNFITLEKF